MRAMLARTRPAASSSRITTRITRATWSASARLGIPIAASTETLAKLRAPAPIRLYRRVTWGSRRRFAHAVTAFESDDAHARRGARTLAPTITSCGTRRRTLFGGDLYLGSRCASRIPARIHASLGETLRRIAALGPTRLFDAHRGYVAEPGAAADREGGLDRGDDRGDRGAHRRWCAGCGDRARVLGGESSARLLSRGDYSRTNFVRAGPRGAALAATAAAAELRPDGRGPAAARSARSAVLARLLRCIGNFASRLPRRRPARRLRARIAPQEYPSARGDDRTGAATGASGGASAYDVSSGSATVESR